MEQIMGSDYKWKIVMVGDFSVGKTSLVRRFVFDEFSDSYLTTIGVKVTKKELVINNSVIADFLLWDIAGSDKFTNISPEYIKGASAGIVVADLTRKITIENIPTHIELLKSENPSMKICVALNKSDLVEDIKESLQLAENGSKGSNVNLIIPTSARNGMNVEDMFVKLGNLIFGENQK